MATVKVWNLTDVSTDRPRVLGICNQSVRPGQHCLVPEKRLARLDRLVAQQLIAVGNQPPAWYLKARNSGMGASKLPSIAPTVLGAPKSPSPAVKPSAQAPATEIVEEVQQVDPPSEDGLELKSKKQLRDLCREKDLPPEGSKTEMLARLRDVAE
jgi:hypothetical protein